MNYIKRDLNKSINNVLNILKNNQFLLKEFKDILKSRYNNNVSTLSSSWYDSGFVNKLTDFATSSYTTNQLNKNQQANLTIQLDKIKAQNNALDKQIILKNSGSFSSSFFKELYSSPIKIGIMIGLVMWYIKRN